MPFQVLQEKQAATLEEPVYWCAHPPRLAQSKPDKIIQHPFLKECAELCEDEVTRHLFEKAAIGSLPSGFALRKKPAFRISARVKKNVHTQIIPTDHHEAIEAIKGFLKEHGVGNVDMGEYNQAPLAKPKASTYHRSLSHRKPFRNYEFQRFVETQAMTHNMTADQVKDLAFTVHVGFALKHFQCPHLDVRNQTIVGIKDLVHDGKGNFRIHRKTTRTKKRAPSKTPLKKRAPSKKKTTSHTTVLPQIKATHVEELKFVRRPREDPEPEISLRRLLMQCDL